jgi:hypothetical protein
MARLDVAKEQISYLKFWLGILVVSGISLFGWLVGNFGGADAVKYVSGGIGLMVLGAGSAILHHRIAKLIQSLGDP